MEYLSTVHLLHQSYLVLVEKCLFGRHWWHLSLGYSEFDLPLCSGRLTLVVGEPKSRIMQKHKIFAPEKYTAEFLYMDCFNIG